MNNSINLTADILARTEQNHIKFIDLQFTDVVGVVKNVTVPVHELAAALDQLTGAGGADDETNM